MHHDVNAFERAAYPVRVADVTDEIADSRVLALRELLAHFELLELVAAIDDQPTHVRETPEHVTDESLAEGTCAPRHEDGRIAQHVSSADPSRFCGTQATRKQDSDC